MVEITTDVPAARDQAISSKSTRRGVGCLAAEAQVGEVGQPHTHAPVMVVGPIEKPELMTLPKELSWQGQ